MLENRDRRAAVLRIGALFGLAGLGDLGLVADALAAAPRANAAPELLTPAELQLTGVLADLVIPRTDTPGALDVGAHRTVDHLLAVCAPAPDQAAFRAGLARIDGAARAGGPGKVKGFTALPPARQAALLQALDSGAAPFAAADRAFFRQLKAYVVFAYYTSEAGASQELAYLPVPGGFKGDIPVTRTTRAWAI
jgi:hypothetical protein